MKSKILSLLGIAAISFTVACNSAGDESTNADTATSTSTTVDNGAATASADVQTTSDGRRYILRARGGASASASGSTSGSTAGASGSTYDTVWVWMGSDDRYYTLGGTSGTDTLYYNTEDWNTWWSNPETDNELKSKSGNTKVKVDDDGSWKVKDDTSKTKMDESGKVKTKKRDN